MQTGKLKRQTSPCYSSAKQRRRSREVHDMRKNWPKSPCLSGSVEKQCSSPLALNTALDERDTSADIEIEDEVDHRSVNVAVRIRPFTRQELLLENNKNVIRVQGNSLYVETDASDDLITSETKFEFDHCLWSFSHESGTPFASQEMVYELLGSPLLDKAIEGYNTCLFAYGMTSSGKSFSIVGTRTEEGIIPRISTDLFDRISHFFNQNGENEMKIEICFYEIYNERIRDLFIASHDKSVRRKELRVREHPEQGPYVEGLTTYAVRSHEDVRAWISLATKRRATASTSLNEQSSRSHAVFVFVIHRSTGERYVTSRINIVDLAGCERLNSSGTTGIRQKEGASINRSLLTLGRVISLLAEYGSDAAFLYKERKIHIPYRDSTLTWLLRESLGGNSQTTMLTTISPSSTVIEETICTLRYAAKARHVVNCARIFEDPTSKIIRELRSEISRMTKQRENEQNLPVIQRNYEHEISVLRKALTDKEEAMEAMKKRWQKDMSCADRLRKEAVSQLENRGLMSPSASGALRSNGQHGRKDAEVTPSLINLHSDILLNEALIYPIRVGDTLISNKSEIDSEMTICLGGHMIGEKHSLLKFVNGALRIEPLDLNSGTFVNGQWIERETSLYDGDRVVFGDQYFRVQLPSKPEAGLEADTNFLFNRARIEHLRGQEIRGQWLLIKQRADSEIERLNEILLSREARIKELEKELDSSRNAEVQTNERQLQKTPERTEDIGCDCSFVSENVPDDHNELTLWTKITEANQICKKIGIKAFFYMRTHVFGPSYIKLNFEERGKSFKWSIETFTNALNDLRTAWEMDSDPDNFRTIINREDKSCSLLENTQSFSETSINISFNDNNILSPSIQEEKENDPEQFTNFIHIIRDCAINGIRELSDSSDDHGIRSNSITHLSNLYNIIQDINPSGKSNCPLYLQKSMVKMCYHLLISMGLLFQDIREHNDLKLGFRKLGNAIEVLCTNLRYQIRNLQSYVVEDKPEYRVQEVIENIKTLLSQSDIKELQPHIDL